MKFLKTRAFPTFYQDYAPKLIEFFGVWIDWLNDKDNSAYVIDHLSTERDIDASIDAYKTHIKDKLLVDYPETISSDLKLLLKNIFYLYNSKSSIKSYDFLFRCLFNSPATITYPKNEILRASDGRWNIPKYLSVCKRIFEDGEYIYDNCSTELSNDCSSFLMIGEVSGAKAYINGHTVFSFIDEDEATQVRNSILLASVDGEFISGERLIIRNPENDEVQNINDVFVEFYGEGKGGWTGQSGFLNSSPKLQDSYYYQDFSYVIRSKVSISKWRNIVKNVIHPAGLEVFGDLLLSDDEDNNGVGDLYVNPTDFLRNWYLIFKMYVFDVSTKINFHNWVTKVNVLAQRHSETQDAWIYYGHYHQNDGYSKIVVDTANNYFNRSSVLLFRENGTLIHPEIINWGLFEFTENIEGNIIHGVTLDPQSHIIYGNINGNSWKPEIEESFIPKNFMMFVTDTSPNQNNKVKGFVIGNEYLRYDENTEGEDFLVGETYLSYEAKKFPGDITKWNDLTVKDYIATSKETDRHYDNKSLMKVPDNFISTDENKYTIENRSYDNERVVVYSYSPMDFTHRIFIDRENNKVNLHYTSFDWYNSPIPQSPIIDSNLHILDTSVSITSDAHTNIYNCESFSYDDEGVAYNLQQTQFNIELPYVVDKEHILLFTDGKLSTNYKLKNNVILIDTEDNEREVICYIQDDGRITTDKAGHNLLYTLDEKSIIYNKEEILFLQSSGYISTDYIGLNLKYKVSGRAITNLNGIVKYYWQDDNTITSDEAGTTKVYDTKNCKLIINRDAVQYFIQENKTVTLDVEGEKVVYYVQPDNTITTNYILYNSSITKFEECTLETILSKSETNSTKLEEFKLLDEIVIELDNAVTKEFGDLILSEVVYYIYGIEQTRMKSTAELYLLSPTNAMRQETTPYTQDLAFTYDAAILSPFGLYNTKIKHFHIADYKNLYNMDIESNEWWRRWFKSFMSETKMLKKHRISLTIPSQRHSETMDDVFARNLVNMYSIRLMDDKEKECVLNKNSTLIFDENGILIDQDKIDWFNMTVDGSNVLYSLQLMPNTTYEKGDIPEENNFFLFVDGVKILDGYRRYNNNENLLKNGARICSYHENLIADYYTGSDNVIYLKNNGSTNTQPYLKDIEADTIVVLSDGTTKRFKDVFFTDVIEKYVYMTTGMDKVTVKSVFHNINTDYVLVFIDGYYTKNWEYRTNGTIVLHDKPEKTYEVYILNPLDYNSQDMTVKGTNNSFTFNNLRLNPYIKAAQIKLIDEKMFASNADILFINKQLRRLSLLKQSMTFWKNFIKDNKNALPNIMLHYTMDRLLLDGSFDVHSYSSNEKLTEVKTPTRFISDLNNGNIEYYIQSNNTITNDFDGTNIEYYLIDNGIYSDSDGTNLVYRIKGYNVLLPEEDTIVYHLRLMEKQFVDTPTKYISDLDGETIVYYIQSNNTITEDVYGENIVYYLIDNGIYSDSEGINLVYTINDNEVLSLDDTLTYYIVYDGKLINTLESKFNRYSTMLFDNDGYLINPDSINWGYTVFRVPQLTDKITAVCLNGNKPALIDDLVNTNQSSLLTSQASILDNVSISKMDMETIENLDVTNDVLRNSNTYETDSLGTVGVTDYLYQKISDESKDTLYAREDEFISENIFVFVNGKKVYKDDLGIDTEKMYYFVNNEAKYTNSRLATSELGELSENDIIMLMKHDLSSMATIEGDDGVLYVEDEISIDNMEDFTEKTDVVHKILNSKECVIFHYNPDDLDAIIEEKHPSSRFFTLPEVGYTKDNILAFRDGIRTTDYYISGDKICFNEGNIDTIEIYIFKKYDYLFVDENKYNKNCYDFIIKNIKRSIFF